MSRSSADVTPTAAVVLGLLALNGPSTPYELEQAVDVSLGHFWSFPRSQLYSEPTRLLERGFVSERREQTGRRRRTFQLTKAGRAALQRWLAEPTTGGSEIRDLGLLRLFFGAVAADPSHVTANAVAQVTVHEEQLAAYRVLDSAAGQMEPHVAATLRLGLAYEAAAVAFWRSLTASPPKP